jgi:hypothetical protein
VGRISRLEDVDVGRVLDQAARVPRRQLDVLDDRVEQVLRIYFAVCASDETLVGPDPAEADAAECG